MSLGGQTLVLVLVLGGQVLVLVLVLGCQVLINIPEYTQVRKPSEGGDRGSDDTKKTKGKETIIGYAERVSERIVVCGTKEKGGKQERV